MFSRISFRVGRIEIVLRLEDFYKFPYFSFQEWYACLAGRCSSVRWLLPSGGWEGRRKEIEIKLWSVWIGPGLSAMVG